MTATYVPTPADFDALVAYAHARGIDPLAVATVLYFESAGFEPGPLSERLDKSGAYAVGGLNQMSADNLDALGITPDDWLARTAAGQLAVIFPWWDSLVHTFAGGAWPTDPAHLEALNYLPGRYRDRGAATNPSAVLATRGEGLYNAPLDPKPTTGSVTVTTIGRALSQSVAAGGARWAMLAAGIAGAVARAAAGAGGGPSSPPNPPSTPATPPATAPATPNAKRGGSLLAIALAAAVAFAWKGRALVAALVLAKGAC